MSVIAGPDSCEPVVGREGGRVRNGGMAFESLLYSAIQHRVSGCRNGRLRFGNGQNETS